MLDQSSLENPFLHFRETDVVVKNLSLFRRTWSKLTYSKIMAREPHSLVFAKCVLSWSSVNRRIKRVLIKSFKIYRNYIRWEMVSREILCGSYKDWHQIWQPKIMGSQEFKTRSWDANVRWPILLELIMERSSSSPDLTNVGLWLLTAIPRISTFTSYDSHLPDQSK